MNWKSNGLIKATVLILASVVPLSPSALLARDNADAKLIALIESDQRSVEVAPGAWPDVSSSGLHNLDTQDGAVLAELRAIARNGLRPENRELYDLLEWQIDSRLDQMRVRLYLSPFSDDRRLLSGGRVLGAIDPLWSLPKPATLSEYQERIRKFESFPQYITQVVALLQEAKAARMLPAHQLAWQAVTSVGLWLNEKPGIARNYFTPNTSITEAERTLYAPFRSMEAIDPADRVRLQETARKTIRERVLPAIGTYYDTLSQEYLPACPEWASLSQWPNGGDVYRVLLRLSTTTDLDPKQLQNYGFQEVKRIRLEMAALIPRTGFKGSLDEFLIHAQRSGVLFQQRRTAAFGLSRRNSTDRAAATEGRSSHSEIECTGGRSSRRRGGFV